MTVISIDSQYTHPSLSAPDGIFEQNIAMMNDYGLWLIVAKRKRHVMHTVEAPMRVLEIVSGIITIEALPTTTRQPEEI